MSNNIFDVLSADSVQKLKRHATSNPDIIDQDFEQICDDLGLQLVGTGYLVKQLIDLINPEGMKQEENFDFENCFKILEILPELTPAQATDERLWVTLCFSRYKEYAKSRWPFRSSEGEKFSNHVSNHWFANGVRGRMRDNALSRLWWMGYTANRVSDMSAEEVLKILFANSDYRSSLLERTSSANSINLLTSIIKITAKAYNDGIEYDRNSFREFMSKVDTLGGRTILASLDERDLIKMLSPVYIDCFKKINNN